MCGNASLAAAEHHLSATFLPLATTLVWSTPSPRIHMQPPQQKTQTHTSIYMLFNLRTKSGPVILQLLLLLFSVCFFLSRKSLYVVHIISFASISHYRHVAICHLCMFFLQCCALLKWWKCMCKWQVVALLYTFFLM